MIELHGVSKWYGAHQVLREIDLKVAAGEVVVVCGPSGSGKSTLIRCINGLGPVQRGEVIVDGRVLGAPDTDLARLRADIGVVFQSLNLYPHMTVLHTIPLPPPRCRAPPPPRPYT